MIGHPHLLVFPQVFESLPFVGVTKIDYHLTQFFHRHLWQWDWLDIQRLQLTKASCEVGHDVGLWPGRSQELRYLES